MHKDLKNAGLLNPLDTPHHLRANEFSKYREGIVQAGLSFSSVTLCNYLLDIFQRTLENPERIGLLERKRVKARGLTAASNTMSEWKKKLQLFQE